METNFSTRAAILNIKYINITNPRILIYGLNLLFLTLIYNKTLFLNLDVLFISKIYTLIYTLADKKVTTFSICSIFVVF